MRKVDTVDIEDVQVIPRLRKLRGPAKVEVRALLRNVTRESRNVSLVFTLPQRYVFEAEPVDAGASRELTKSFAIDRPRLWQPGRPALYDLGVRGGHRRGAARPTG